MTKVTEQELCDAYAAFDSIEGYDPHHRKAIKAVLAQRPQAWTAAGISLRQKFVNVWYFQGSSAIKWIVGAG